MANASAEKLKALGIRHGEKVVMALTTAICAYLMYTAVTLKTIDLTPEQVRQAAQTADSNLNRNQPREDILKLLEDSQIKNPGFTAIVEQQEKNLLVADNFRSRQLWVTPEPGAGLIRDQPDLVAPKELYAYPGRGGALVFELDENGNRIPDPDAGTNQDEPTQVRRKRRAASPSAAKARARAARRKEEAKQRQELEQKKKMAAIVGGPSIAKQEQAAQDAQGAEKEKTQGLRWVAITGVLDNKTLRENYLNALKRPEVAYPHFKQVDIERQAKQPDGSWSDWEAVDLDRNRLILDNLPEEDEEWTPEEVRLGALVAPLPFLKAGFWERVHVARMVPKEKLEVAAAGGGQGDVMPGGDVMPEGEMRRAEAQGMPVEAMPGGVEGSAGGSPESIDFEKTDVDEVMVRALDFTIEPDVTYRFRLRVVVYNPNRGREDVTPGIVDTKSLDLSGPWSDPTEEVTVPPDVATYALDKEVPIRNKLDRVRFEVACWTPEDGVTVVKTFPASPGDIIGEAERSNIPVADSSGKKPLSRLVDFNSHQLVLDLSGGNLPIPSIGAGSGQFAIPAQSLVLRPDGAVAIRSQAIDVQDQIRKDISENFHRAISDIEARAKKKKKR